MPRYLKAGLLLALAAGLVPGCSPRSAGNEDRGLPLTVSLPAPRRTGPRSVEETLAARRSVRAYRREPLSVAEVAQILWAAQGITAAWGGKTAPSAGATYPLELLVVAGEVEGLSPGVYRYLPDQHALRREGEQDVRRELSQAALGQAWVREAPLVLVVAAEFGRTTGRYGERGVRYVHMEVGHVAQNVYLQAEALGLGTVSVGAFHDDQVKRILAIGEEPLLIMPVGRPAG